MRRHTPRCKGLWTCNPHDCSMIDEVRGEVYLAQGRPIEALEEMEKEPAGYVHELGFELGVLRLGAKEGVRRGIGEG